MRCTLMAMILFLGWSESSATVMSAAGSLIPKTVMDQGGAGWESRAHGGGTPTQVSELSFSLGQPAMGLLAAPRSELSGGFYGSLADGSQPQIVARAVTEMNRLVQERDAFLGVPCVSSVTLTFDKPMHAQSVAAGVRLRILRDRLGSGQNSSEPFSWSYDAQARQFALFSREGCWHSNTLFELDVTADSRDQEGLALANPASLRFLTLADPAVENVMTPLRDFDTRVRVEPGTFTEFFYFRFGPEPLLEARSFSRDLIDEANRKLGSPVILLRDFSALDSQSNPLQRRFLGQQAVLSLPYRDGDGDGYVDGFGRRSLAQRLAIYELDPALRAWVSVPGSRVDLTQRRVLSPVPRPSLYALAAEPFAGVDSGEPYAYPVPFRPRGPIGGAGVGRSGSEAQGIAFSNIPPGGRVEVYNVRGELVWRGEPSGIDGKLDWDVRNLSGRAVASGVYIYSVLSSERRSVGKLAIVR